MRKLILAAAMAFAALGILAPAAFAETEAPVAPSQVGEVIDEATGAHCGQVMRHGHDDVEGGCPIHAVAGTSDMVAHSAIFGELLQARCSNEFVGQIGEDGTGWISMSNIDVGHSNEAGASGNCGDDGQPAEGDGIDNCSAHHAEEENHPGDWPVEGYEDSDGSLWLDVEICLENTTSDTVTGHLWVRVIEDPVTHHVTGFEAEDHRLRNVHGTSFDLEFDGHWAVEGDEIEVSH